MDVHIFSGHAQLPEGTNLSFVHKFVTIVLKIDMETGEILDSSVPMYCDLHDDFVKKIIIGNNIETDFQFITNEISERVHSLSTKSLITALQVVYNRYSMVRQSKQDRKAI